MTPLDSCRADDLIRRVKSEFIEMPGLRLTLLQAKRLWALPHEDCERVLQALVERRFLILGTDGKFSRLSEETGALPPARLANAGFDAQPEARRFQRTS